MLEFSWEETRIFVVDEKIAENDIITSFYLKPEDGKPLPSFLPGQFLPLDLDIPGEASPVKRTYTLSSSANDTDHYRLTIKREPEGKASIFFHDKIDVGAKLNAKNPAGKFHLDMESDKPVVLLSGGVGLTPMISMLNTICENGAGRKTWFLHGTRGRNEHCMGEHVRALAAKHANVSAHIVYEKTSPEDVKGEHYDSEGYFTGDLLQDLLGDTDYEFYLCGPPPFMKAVYNALCDWGVDENAIHYEFFGPATVLREGAPGPDQASPVATENAAVAGPMVTFSDSDKSAPWDAKFENLLDFAESLGLAPAFSCRSGICHTCMIELKDGEVNYPEEPVIPPDPGHVLICSAQPKGDIDIDL
ncbi:MAG: FAD-binding oxidoreductase [Rhodospirillales bacterium]